MEDRMEQLSRDVSRLADHSLEVNDRFADRRGQVRMAGAASGDARRPV